MLLCKKNNARRVLIIDCHVREGWDGCNCKWAGKRFLNVSQMSWAGNRGQAINEKQYRGDPKYRTQETELDQEAGYNNTNNNGSVKASGQTLSYTSCWTKKHEGLKAQTNQEDILVQFSGMTFTFT